MFDRQLQAQCGFTTAACGSDDGPFIYLDDIVFTGNRVKNDLAAWIDSSAPQEATLHVVVLALHRAGWDYADDELRAISRTARKRIDIKWWRDIEVEDRGSCSQQSDVLRPATIPDDPDTQEYISGLVYNGQWYPPVPRSGTSIGENKFFSSHDGRCLLEQQFLRTGIRIRRENHRLQQSQRPLGFKKLQSLGFGSLIVTFRNCPNNCPLVFWANNPWYPLFPRSTNTDAANGRWYGPR